MLSPFGGYLLYQQKQFSSLMIITGLVLILGSVYALLRLIGIHLVGEEGDYILICMTFIFWVTAGFQFLRINHKWLGKVAFSVTMSPLIILFPYLGWLLMCMLKWVLT